MLMAVARLEEVVRSLQGQVTISHTGMQAELGHQNETTTTGSSGKVYPAYTPIAIIERASMRDQRVITSTLRNVVEAIESIGEQRPPGMMVVGWAVLALWGTGDVGVLDEGGKKEEDSGDNGEEFIRRDKERVEKWLGGRKWRMQEGLGREWEELESLE